MRSYKMAVYSTSLTDRTVRQVIENTKEEIERGADVYSFHELTYCRLCSDKDKKGHTQKSSANPGTG